MKRILIFLVALSCLQCSEPLPPPVLELGLNDHIVLVGGNLCSQMDEYAHFETELHLRYPEHNLMVRNLCDPGNTPGFRPHSARNTSWVYPGAEKYYQGSGLDRKDDTQGDFPTPEAWLEELEVDIILGFFGWSESFAGPEGVEN
ncbi:MAG: dehydrogenase, partial [Bacteroidota bacterium]